MDLAADRILAADKGGEKIAVEIKSFLNPSAITDFYAALGQFLRYRIALNDVEPSRTLYLAVPVDAYRTFFKLQFARAAVEQYQIKVNGIRAHYRRDCDMEKLSDYKHAVQHLLLQYSQADSSEEGVKTQLMFDDERGHYQWMDIG